MNCPIANRQECAMLLSVLESEEELHCEQTGMRNAVIRVRVGGRTSGCAWGPTLDWRVPEKAADRDYRHRLPRPYPGFVRTYNECQPRQYHAPGHWGLVQ